MDLQALAKHNLVFRCISGSRAYGTSIAGSDVDLRGVFATGQLGAMTPFFPVGQVDAEGDDVTFELAKFAGMVAEQNPNILELLWTDRENVLFEAPEWRLLREQREALLTTKVRTTYGGYATSQIKRMLAQETWRRNPQPEAPPVPADFLQISHDMAGLGEMPDAAGRWTLVALSRDSFLLYEGGSGSWRDAAGNLRAFPNAAADGAGGQPLALVSFNRKAYESRHRDHANYWTWLANRNQAKAGLAERLGYEPKAAGHLIRLLRTAHEALSEGVIRVRRPDAAELLAIRSGEWPLQRVMDTAAALEAGLPEAERASRLPRSLDVRPVAEAVVAMYRAVWSRTRREPSVPGGQPGGWALHEPQRDAPDPRGRMVVLDTEMSGWTDPGQRRVVEVGAVEVMGGLVTGQSFHAYVNPMARLNRMAVGIHGLDSRFLADKPGFEEVAPDLLAFLGDADILCHNAPSDLGALNNDLALCGMETLPPERFACTERMARRLLRVVKISLDDLCAALDVPVGPRSRGHSAMVDASVLASCALKLAEFDAYPGLRGTRVARPAGPPLGRPVAGITPDGGGLRFVLPDGRVIEAPAPDYPEDTHELVARDDGRVVVRQRGREAPDNPLGPALFGLRGDAVVAFPARGQPAAGPPQTAEDDQPTVPRL